MRTLILRLIVIPLCTVAFACERASTPLSPTSDAVTRASGQTVAIKATTVVFATIPTPPVNRQISAGADVQAFVFSIDTTGTKGQALAELAFMITGSLQAGNLSNFRLVYFPSGLAKPGTVIAANDGSGWVPGPNPSNFLRLRPASFAFSQNFKGVFALVVDVSGTSYFFDARLQTANVFVNGVEQPLLNPVTCDLPLQGDVLYVN